MADTCVFCKIVEGKVPSYKVPDDVTVRIEGKKIIVEK